jgi:hypothetical protein
VRYCEPVISSDLLGRIRTEFYCDWNDHLYQSASECFRECSSLLISKSEASFLILLVFSLFFLGLVFLLAKAVVE